MWTRKIIEGFCIQWNRTIEPSRPQSELVHPHSLLLTQLLLLRKTFAWNSLRLAFPTQHLQWWMEWLAPHPYLLLTMDIVFLTLLGLGASSKVKHPPAAPPPIEIMHRGSSCNPLSKHLALSDQSTISPQAVLVLVAASVRNSESGSESKGEREQRMNEWMAHCRIGIERW